jgi:hypothetical protein
MTQRVPTTLNTLAMEDVILETSVGTIVCEMYYDHAPRTCKNFVELVGETTQHSLTKYVGEARIL